MGPPYRPLRIIGLVYGLCYLLFIAAGTIPATRSMVFSNPTHPEFGLAHSLAWLLFALFVVGLVVWSGSKPGAGLVFVVWYGLIIWMDGFSNRVGLGTGLGMIMGAPGLFLGLLLIGTWALNRGRARKIR